MFARSLLALATAAALAAGKTPAGFTPGADTDLLVAYGRVAPPDGAVVDKAAAGSAPDLATASQLPPDHEYAVIMIDLDVPFDVRPHVLLHWLQTGLRPAATASRDDGGGDDDARPPAFALLPFADQDADGRDKNTLAAYLPPAPPARAPLSHRYVQLLLDTTNASPAGRAVLADAAATRLAFDLPAVLAAAGLQDRVVAGHYFNVTNPGPVDTPAATATTSSSSSSSTTNSPRASDHPPSRYPDYDDDDDLLLGRNATGAGSARPSGVNTGSAAAISSKAALAFSAAPRTAAAAALPTLTAALLLFLALALGHAA